MGALAWLVGSELGRKVAGIGLAILVIGFAVLRIWMAGAASERAKQTQANLQNLRTRVKVNDEIARMSPADRRKRLLEWVSD